LSSVSRPKGQEVAQVRVRRGGPDDPPHYDTFEVPWKEGMSVLDALIWVRQNVDSSLAMRYSCINANACKECSALVDGKVVYVCTERLGKKPVTVEPLPKRPLIRDLVTDILPAGERFSSHQSE